MNRVLFVGGEKGSWAMRGQQIARQIGARHTTRPMQADDWAWPEVIVLVKRAVEQWASDIRKHAKAPLIWDVLDFWAQPEANQRLTVDLLAEVKRIQEQFGIGVLLGATQAMAKDIGGVYLPHHHRIGLSPARPRSTVSVVAYEGSPRYLGRWRGALERACALRGLRFVVNPDDLTQADVLVAFRDLQWDGWACRQWKSGIKYVNALAAGRPILTQPCAAFSEIEPVGETIDYMEQLGDALDGLSQKWLREHAFEEGRRRASQYHIDTIAETYRGVIRQARKQAAA